MAGKQERQDGNRYLASMFSWKRGGTILGVEFEDKSNWLVVRPEEIEATRLGDPRDKVKDAKYEKIAIRCAGTRNYFRPSWKGHLCQSNFIRRSHSSL